MSPWRQSPWRHRHEMRIILPFNLRFDIFKLEIANCQPMEKHYVDLISFCRLINGVNFKSYKYTSIYTFSVFILEICRKLFKVSYLKDKDICELSKRFSSQYFVTRFYINKRYETKKQLLRFVFSWKCKTPKHNFCMT